MVILYQYSHIIITLIKQKHYKDLGPTEFEKQENTLCLIFSLILSNNKRIWNSYIQESVDNGPGV